MNTIQKKMLDLLAEFDEICRENKIRYCVSSGCALGLERNGGFLPWDDDIDLFIEREEYNRLSDYFDANIRENRAWLTEDNFHGYENPLARYVDLTTTLMARSRIDDGSPLGVFLEFFVLDPYPTDKEKQKEYDKYLWLYSELQAGRYMISDTRRFKDVYDEELFWQYKKRVEVEGKKNVLNEIEKEHLTYSYEECEELCAKWGVQRAIIKKKWMQSIEYRNFEGVNLPFFRDNIDYLCYSEYGYDWNIVPSSKQRGSHPILINTDISYRKYEGKLLRYSRRKKLVQNLEANKKTNTKRRFADLNVQDTVGEYKKAALEILAKEWEKQDLTTSYDNLENLSKIFYEYSEIQLRQRYYVTKKGAEIPDKVLDAFLYYLVYGNRVIMAQHVIDCYGGNAITEKYQEIVNLLTYQKVEKYKNNIPNVQESISTLMDMGFDHQIEVERGIMWLATREGTQFEEHELLDKYYSMTNLKDSEIRKYVGDYYYDRGDFAGADTWYMSALKTRNGMILFDMQKKGYY